MALLLFAACHTDPPSAAVDPPICANAPAVTWENWGAGFFLTWCASCHSKSAPDRRGAPDGVDFDSPADVGRWSDRIRARVLDEGTMPLGGGLSDDDALLLDVLLTCGG